MKNLTLIVLLVLIASLLPACRTHEHVVLVSAEEDAIESPAQMVSESTRTAATALLAALTDEQKKQAVHDIKAPLKKDWHYVPRDRQGLMLGDMTAEQKTHVHKLMQTALSDSGYLKATVNRPTGTGHKVAVRTGEEVDHRSNFFRCDGQQQLPVGAIDH